MDRQEDLFGGQMATGQSPLAVRMRPESLDDIVGQTHFLNERFHRLLKSDQWTGFIFWGPPGTGKTTLAWVVARTTHRPFDSLSAVRAGVKEIREVLETSRLDVRMGKPARILFIDEVHRLNKSQQDVLLPYLEDGSVRFIGATTENPSFEINNAIASRCVIFHLEPLSEENLMAILRKAAAKYPQIEDSALEKIALSSLGDARRALTLLEHFLLSSKEGEPLNAERFEELKHAQSLYYDKKSEGHYDTISAFIKSIRGSDPDAAVYYLARMLEAGEDPMFVARRLVILASEDVGNANPLALVLATNGFQAVHSIGMPEARIVLSQIVTYLACSEKSNRSYAAINEAMDVVRRTGSLEIPMHIRNAPTKAMKERGYGKGYQYPHEAASGWVKENYLPEKIRGKRFYQPSEHGAEKRFGEFLRARKGSQEDPNSDRSV